VTGIQSELAQEGTLCAAVAVAEWMNCVDLSVVMDETVSELVA